MSEETPKETALAYAAFLEYCEMGQGRSLRKLAEKRDKSGTKAGQIFKQLGIWSSQHNWQERVKQWDADRIRERIAKKQEKRDEMEDRHAKEAREEQQWAREVLKQGKDKKEKYVSLAAVHLLKNSREDERKALVEDAPIKVEHSGDIGAHVKFYPVELPQKLPLPGSHLKKGEDVPDVSS